MSGEEERLRALEIAHVEVAQAFNAHQKNCDYRNDVWTVKQKETLAKIEELHGDVKVYHKETKARLDKQEELKWAMSGKLIGALVTLISFLLVVIGYLAVHGPPWA